MGHWEVERRVDVFGALTNGSGKGGGGVDGLNVEMEAR